MGNRKEPLAKEIMGKFDESYRNKICFFVG